MPVPYIRRIGPLLPLIISNFYSTLPPSYYLKLDVGLGTGSVLNRLVMKKGRSL